VLWLILSFFVLCICLSTLCRVDEVCSSTNELEANLFPITGDELQLDSVDADVGNELENNENNNNNNNSKYVSS